MLSEVFSCLERAGAHTPDFSETFRGLRTWARLVDCQNGDICKIIFAPDASRPFTMFKFTVRMAGIVPNEVTSVRARNRMLQLSGVPHPDLNRMLTRSQVVAELAVVARMVYMVCFEMDKYGRLVVELSPGPNQRAFNQNLISEGFVRACSVDTEMIDVV